MKIIDLLNKISNGEEIPKEIEYEGSIFHYNSELNDYCFDYEDDEGELHGEYIFTSSFKNITEILNDEVEIIEEDKKIEKIEQWVDVKSWVGNDLEKGLEEQSQFNKNIYYKINEIINYINKEK